MQKEDKDMKRNTAAWRWESEELLLPRGVHEGFNLITPLKEKKVEKIKTNVLTPKLVLEMIENLRN